MPIEETTWFSLQQGTPGYFTNAPSSELTEEQTPDATGLDITVPGFIKKGTIPGNTAKITKTYTIGGNVYTYYYKRGWRTSAAQIIFNAPEYTTAYYAQGKGWIDLNDSATSYLTFLPIGTSGLIFFKTDGSYILPNADDMGSNFGNPKFMQEVHLATATHAVSIDGIVYFGNSDGIFSVEANGQVTEISKPIFGNVTSAALTADYENKYLIVGTTRAFDIGSGKWFKYSGSTFEFISRKFHNTNNASVSINKVGFEFDKTSTAQGNITFKVQTEERGWGSQTYTATVRDVRDEGERVMCDVGPDLGMSFQLKIVSMPATMKIKGIWVRSKNFTPESRDS